MHDARVRALEPGDAPAVVVLRREALTSSPLAFAASHEDDRALSIEFVRTALADAASSAMFGAFDEAALVGMAGVHLLDKVKLRHKAQLWGMYVAPAARGRGLGAALVRAVIDHCRSWPGVLQVQLSVTEAAAEASRVYERAGFREWGREPGGFLWEGRLVDERHLTLILESAAR